MALKFQYNKTFLQQLNKGLKMRENALPTLMAKEAALRLEVKKAREQVVQFEEQLKKETAEHQLIHRLFCEMPEGVIALKEVHVVIKKIAGVKTPVLQNIVFDVQQYSVFSAAAWIPSGIEIVKQLAQLKIELELAKRKVFILEYARKKTTQKVNLYEKVQIPEYQEAIRRIKRFMEDEDNLSKSSQKILKEKMAIAEAA